MKSIKIKPIEIIRNAAKKEFGDSFDEAIFKKALAKLQRWSKLAYGTTSLQHYLENSEPESIEGYYEETRDDQTNGMDTFNRQNYQSTRKDRGN